MATQRKMDQVTELTDKIQKAKVMIFADYRGLKHKQLEELRKLLKKAEGELVVAKNRLIKRALGDSMKSVEAHLVESTAVLFSYADEVAPLKELMKFFKAAGVGKAKAGLMGSVSMDEKQVAKFATLPSKEILLGQLVGQLNAPIQGLHYALSWNMNKLVWALDAIKNKKSN